PPRWMKAVLLPSTFVDRPSPVKGPGSTKRSGVDGRCRESEHGFRTRQVAFVEQFLHPPCPQSLSQVCAQGMPLINPSADRTLLEGLAVVSSWFKSCLPAIREPRRKARPPAQRPTPHRPRLELLEDRTALSNVHLIGTPTLTFDAST